MEIQLLLFQFQPLKEVEQLRLKMMKSPLTFQSLLEQEPTVLLKVAVAILQMVVFLTLKEIIQQQVDIILMLKDMKQEQMVVLLTLKDMKQEQIIHMSMQVDDITYHLWRLLLLETVAIHYSA